MKAAIRVAAIAILGAAIWFSGLLNPSGKNLLITAAKAHPAMDGSIAAVVQIENQGRPDQLLGVSSSLGIATLSQADQGLPIQTGVSSLSLDAAHIRITASDTELEEGALIPLRLTFDRAGDINIKVRFTQPAANTVDAHLLMGHGVMYEPAGGEPVPMATMTVSSSGDGWVASLQTTDFSFSEELQDGAHVPGTGHGHIYIGGMKLGRVFSNSYEIGALPKGRHQLRVTINTNDHRSYVSEGQIVQATAVIEVD